MQIQANDRVDTFLLIGLALLALALAIGMSLIVTERIPHLEDEIAYIYQARVFARGALWGPVPEQRSAFFTPFVLTLGDKRVGKYSIGWPLVLAIGEVFKADWLVSPVMGALTAALIYQLGRDLFNREVGVVAALLGMTSPFFLIQASTYMSHAAAGLWMGLLLWSLLRAEQATQRQGWAALGGFALGMLILTRSLTGVAIVVPVGVYLIVRGIRERRLMTSIRDYWPLAILAVLIAALQPLWLYAVSGSPTTNLYRLVWDYDRVGFGPEVGRVGHTLDQALYTAGQDLKLWSSELYGWRSLSWIPVLAGLIAGIWHKRAGWTLFLLAPFIVLVTVYLAYWIGARVYGPRYYYEGHVGLAVLAGLGLRSVVYAAAGLVGRLRRRVLGPSPAALPGALWTQAAVTITLGTLLAINLTGYLPQRAQEWHALYGITRAPLDELAQLQETDRVLVMVRGGHWLQYAPFFYLNSPWYDDPVIAAHDRDMNRVLEMQVMYPDREVWFYKDGQFSRVPFPYEVTDDS